MGRVKTQETALDANRIALAEQEALGKRLTATIDRMSTKVIPLAVELGVVARDATLAALLEGIDAGTAHTYARDQMKQEAATSLTSAITFLAIAVRSWANGNPLDDVLAKYTRGAGIRAGGDVGSMLLAAEGATCFAQGVLHALRIRVETHAGRTREAANGRKLVGATTREKLRKASADLRHLTRIEAAAELKKQGFGREVETIRKHLTALYPGKAWENGDEPLLDE